MGNVSSLLRTAPDADALKKIQSHCSSLISAHRVCVLANEEEANKYCKRLRENAEACAASQTKQCAKIAKAFYTCVQTSNECDKYAKAVRTCLHRNSLPITTLHKHC